MKMVTIFITVFFPLVPGRPSQAIHTLEYFGYLIITKVNSKLIMIFGLTITWLPRLKKTLKCIQFRSSRGDGEEVLATLNNVSDGCSNLNLLLAHVEKGVYMRGTTKPTHKHRIMYILDYIVLIGVLCLLVFLLVLLLV